MGLMTRPPVVGRDGRDSVGARYLLLMRYFCEGAGPAPGCRTGQREKQTPPTSLRLGDHLAGVGGGTGGGDGRNEEERRRLTLRNGLYGLPG